MTPATQTATQAEQKVYDRSICFTFFQPWLEAIQITAYRLVPQPGLEPGCHLATDFESALSTGFNIVA